MKFTEFALNLIYPPFCVGCNELLPFDSPIEVALCPACYDKWQKAREAICPDCKQHEDECRCRPSALRKMSVECAHLVPYRNAEGEVERLLLTAKEENYRHLFRFFGKELAERSESLEQAIEQDALVTWLPRSRRRASEKGIDQAKEVAKAFAEIRSLEVAPLFKRINGGAQKNLTATERFDHARSAYKLSQKCPPVKGRTIVLIDDIFTTGATMLAAIELLGTVGAGRIVCLTVAMTRSTKGKPANE